MERRRIILALLLLALATLACNPPTDQPTAAPATVTPFIPGGETPTSPTPQTPPSPTPSAESSPSPTETATPTPTPTNTPEPTAQSSPVSTGPLDFNVPTSVDHWEPTGDGNIEVTINLHITGGAPPFTIHHDMETFNTSQRNYALVFERGGCSAIVHTIVVQSADGQQVSHDYYIPAPWCITPSP